MRSPADVLDELADALTQQAARLRARVELDAQLAAGEERIAALRAESEGLPHGTRPRTISDMNVDTRGRSSDVKRGAGRATRKHPAQRRLYENGMTVSSLAKELGETRARVSSWFAAGDANRPIPRHHAETLLKRYKIALGDWSRIAD